MLRLLFYIILIATLSIPMYAQSVSDSFYAGINYTPGKIIIHSPKLYLPAPPYSDVVTLTLQKKTGNNQLWKTNFNKPTINYSLSFLRSSDSRIGNTIAFTGNWGVRVAQYNKWELQFATGTGVAYATKKWNNVPITDTINNFLGTHINMAAYVGLHNYVYINNYSHIQAAVSFSHASNGAVRKPNLGLNHLGLQVGYFYKIKNSTFLYYPQQNIAYKNKEIDIMPKQKKLGIDVRISATATEYGNGNGAIVPVYVGAIMGTYTYKQKHKLLLGVDAEYNYKTILFIRNTRQVYSTFLQDATYYSLFVGNAFLLGRFSVPIQVGYYLNSPYLKPNNYYQKFGLLYYLPKFKKLNSNTNYGKGFYTGVLLKSNNFNADIVEFCLGKSF